MQQIKPRKFKNDANPCGENVRLLPAEQAITLLHRRHAASAFYINCSSHPESSQKRWINKYKHGVSCVKVVTNRCISGLLPLPSSLKPAVSLVPQDTLMANTITAAFFPLLFCEQLSVSSTALHCVRFEETHPNALIHFIRAIDLFLPPPTVLLLAAPGSLAKLSALWWPSRPVSTALAASPAAQPNVTRCRLQRLWNLPAKSAARFLAGHVCFPYASSLPCKSNILILSYSRLLHKLSLAFGEAVNLC